MQPKRELFVHIVGTSPINPEEVPVLPVHSDKVKHALQIDLRKVASLSSLSYQPSGVINRAVMEGVRLLVNAIVDSERCVIIPLRYHTEGWGGGLTCRVLQLALGTFNVQLVVNYFWVEGGRCEVFGGL